LLQKHSLHGGSGVFYALAPPPENPGKKLPRWYPEMFDVRPEGS
jgi:hypothetical protein